MSKSGVCLRVLNKANVGYDGNKIIIKNGVFEEKDGEIIIRAQKRHFNYETLIYLGENLINYVFVDDAYFEFTQLLNQEHWQIHVEVSNGGNVNLANSRFSKIRAIVHGTSFVSNAKATEGDFTIFGNGEINNVYVETRPRVSCKEGGFMNVLIHTGETVAVKYEKVYERVKL